MHWIDTVVGPLFEMNPIEYALDEKYRRQKQFHLGAKAARLIFVYQCTMFAIFAASSIALTIYLLRSA